MKTQLILVSLLFFVASTISVNQDFRGKLQDNIEDIFQVIGNIPHAFSFLNAIETNPTVAFEQALVGLSRKHLDEASTTSQLITNHGYGFTLHYVTTDDGYILQLYRVFNPNLINNDKVKDPILLLHGVFVSCNNWVFNGDQSLAFFLADRNKDVWLLCSLGTTYSTNHTKLNPYIGKFKISLIES